MAITSVDDIAAAIALQQPYPFMKVLGAAKSAGAFQSGWMAAGRPGAGVASPAFNTSGYTCSRTTTGAVGQTNGAVQNWIAKLIATTTQPATLFIYDRLWSCSGMGFAASTYTVTSPSTLPARITDSGVGVEAFVEQFVAAGAASGSLTLTYVNSSSTAGRTGVITGVVSAPVAGQLQPIPWQAGDVGISQVTNAINSATWTSGTFGITLAKKVAAIPIGAIGVAQPFDWSIVLNKIHADACLMFAIQASNTTATTVFGDISIIDK